MVGQEFDAIGERKLNSETKRQWKRVRRTVWEAVEELTKGQIDFEFAPKDVTSHISAKDPMFKLSNVSAQLIADCVNHPSRHHHSGNQDLYWWEGRGRYRLYDRKKDTTLQET